MTGEQRIRIPRNQPNVMDGRALLATLAADTVPLGFLDPQYRGVLDYLKYGNEGARQSRRHALPAMSDQMITEFVVEIARVLRPSGHLGLWADKYTIGTGRHLQWLAAAPALCLVDLITWDTGRFGMGKRARSRGQTLIVIQKLPRRVKGCWSRHDITDVWLEHAAQDRHPHAKPVVLQQMLIRATTKRGDLVIDPAAGSYSVLQAARFCGREFLGCDLVDPERC